MCRIREANAQIDKLGKVLNHDIISGDLSQEVFPSTVLQTLECNLSGPDSIFKSNIQSR